jgi:hypothetical protein
MIQQILFDIPKRGNSEHHILDGAQHTESELLSDDLPLTLYKITPTTGK